jgi:hypothetical protein
MLFLLANAQRPTADDAGRLPSEAITGLALEGTFERMARRRYQKPEPFIEGNWWWIVVRQDHLIDGKLTRKTKRIKSSWHQPILQDKKSKKSETNSFGLSTKDWSPSAQPLNSARMWKVTTRERFSRYLPPLPATTINTWSTST